jgi:hypothetical protein
MGDGGLGTGCYFRPSALEELRTIRHGMLSPSSIFEWATSCTARFGGFLFQAKQLIQYLQKQINIHEKQHLLIRTRSQLQFSTAYTL